MKSNYVSTSFLLLLASTSFAQAITERFVHSSCGFEYQNDSNYFSVTIGQPCYSTLSLSGFALTQGFQQPPEVANPMSISFSVQYNECEDLYMIQVDTISMCEPEVLQISWNGVLDISPFYTDQTLVSIDVKSTGGCTWTTALNLLTFPVEVIPCPLIFYGLITPNGDEANDSWIIEYIEGPESLDNKVTILNRWGSIVWEGINYDNHNTLWTGNSLNGNALPDGTYFYYVDTENQSYHGYVELQR